MRTRHTQSGVDIDAAARILRQGGLVAIPTETVYGLAAHALNTEAVAGIFAAKERPEFDPLIVHIFDRDQLAELCNDIPHLARRLMDEFWPGPLTFVLDKSEAVPDLVTSALPTVGIRMPEHPVARELLQRSRLPLAAPSANLFGKTSPTTAAHVMKQLDGRIDYILDGGECRVGVESTIVRCQDDSIQLLRPGGIPREELERFGRVTTIQEAGDDHPVAPGQLPEHYAPNTPLRIVTPAEVPVVQPGTALLTLQLSSLPADFPVAEFATVTELAADGDLTLAAARFFAALHSLDELELTEILATPFPATGLGVALNDRLQRAAARG